MTRIKEFINNNYQKIWFTFLINFLVLVFYLVFFNCCFEMNDDYEMKMMASGVYGHPEYHLVYINTLFGYILYFLYNITTLISWYEFAQITVIYLSFSILTYVFSNKLSKEVNILFIPIIILIAYNFYVWPQFTKNAAIATCSGYVGIAYGLKMSEKKSTILGIVLLTFGMWLRTKQFLACSAICAFIFIPYILENKKHFIKTLKVGLVCLFILLASIGVEKINYSSEEWSNYDTYNKTLTKVRDYGWPDYEENIELYEEIGVDEETLDLYKVWCYADNDKINVDSIERLVSASSNKQISIGYILTFIYRFIYFYTSTVDMQYLSLLFVALIVLYILYSKKDTITNLTLAANALVTLGIIFYCYFIRMDSFLNRTTVSFIVSSIFTVTYLCEIEDLKINTKKTAIISFVLFAFIMATRISCLDFSFMGINNSENNRDNVYQEIINDSDHLYVISSYYDVDTRNELFVKPKIGERRNIVYLGGWETNYPLLKESTAYYGVENLYKDLINNEKAYLATNDLEPIITYINKYYDSNAKAVEVKEIDDLSVYLIVSK